VHPGVVYLVGVGPGDPELITVKGRRLIECAEVVVYDHLVSSILVQSASPAAEIVYAGKRSGMRTMEQHEINCLLVARARCGKIVVRLKGGDPFVFGRGGEEALALVQAGVRFEVVPGVSSAVAVPAYAGIPVTMRDATSMMSVITGHRGGDNHLDYLDWPSLVNGKGTLIFLMGIRTLPRIVDRLVENGIDRDMPVAVIEWGTTSKQRKTIGTIADIVEQADRKGVWPPGVIVVGEVVRLSEKLDWYRPSESS